MLPYGGQPSKSEVKVNGVPCYLIVADKNINVRTIANMFYSPEDALVIVFDLKNPNDGEFVKWTVYRDIVLNALNGTKPDPFKSDISAFSQGADFFLDLS